MKPLSRCHATRVQISHIAFVALALSGCSGDQSAEGRRDLSAEAGRTGSVSAGATPARASSVAPARDSAHARDVTDELPAAPDRHAPPPRDADQDFLRRMMDHHEALRRDAHKMMMDPAGHAMHGAGADPAFLDGRLDAEQGELVVLLKQLYREDYSAHFHPKPGAPAAGTDTAPSRMTMQEMDKMHDASIASLARQFRDGVAMIDHFKPRLVHGPVRALAMRIRTSQLDLAARMRGEPK